jgi:hypothetical protein
MITWLLNYSALETTTCRTDHDDNNVLDAFRAVSSSAVVMHGSYVVVADSAAQRAVITVISLLRGMLGVCPGMPPAAGVCPRRPGYARVARGRAYADPDPCHRAPGSSPTKNSEKRPSRAAPSRSCSDFCCACMIYYQLSNALAIAQRDGAMQWKLSSRFSAAFAVLGVAAD